VVGAAFGGSGASGSGSVVLSGYESGSPVHSGDEWAAQDPAIQSSATAVDADAGWGEFDEFDTPALDPGSPAPAADAQLAGEGLQSGLDGAA